MKVGVFFFFPNSEGLQQVPHPRKRFLATGLVFIPKSGDTRQIQHRIAELQGIVPFVFGARSFVQV